MSSIEKQEQEHRLRSNCGSDMCAMCSTTRHQQHEGARFCLPLPRPSLAPALPTLSPSTSVDKLDVLSLIDAALAVLESDTLDDIDINETES